MAKQKNSPAGDGPRTLSDTLGEVSLPSGVYYGAQTQRAVENFPISGLLPSAEFIIATAYVKYAAAEANTELGLLTKKRGGAIKRAAAEIIDGKLHEDFVVDIFQAGAGTSHNMNANEVIASRAAEIMGSERGDWATVHPNDHVNMAQSTNDTFPTAMRIATLVSSKKTIRSIKALERALDSKGRAFSKIIKSGRTHLQDAVPVMLGSEFTSYASALRRARIRMESSLEGLSEIGLGATAAGTGINSHPRYAALALRSLKSITGLRGLKKAPDLHEYLNSFGPFTSLSGELRALAIELGRIANDLRLLSSGPNTGLGEIKLEAVQPGSSIMPGKVNPVMAEMLNMVCYQVIGNDTAISAAAGAGQLELNVMGPVIISNTLSSLKLLRNAVDSFTTRCVSKIKADKGRCLKYFEESEGLATILNRYIGYENAAAIVKEAASSGRTLREVLADGEILSEEEISSLLKITRLTGPC